MTSFPRSKHSTVSVCITTPGKTNCKECLSFTHASYHGPCGLVTHCLSCLETKMPLKNNPKPDGQFH